MATAGESEETCKEEIYVLVQSFVDNALDQEKAIGGYRLAQFRMRLHELESEAIQGFSR